MNKYIRTVIVTSIAVVGLFASTALPASASSFQIPIISGAISLDIFPQFPQVHGTWDLRTTTGPVTAYNEVSAASIACTGCEAVAVSFQIIMDSNAAPLTPLTSAGNLNNLNLTNSATVAGPHCTNCQIIAMAYQWVVADPGQQLAFTPAGQQAVASIHQQLNTILASGEPALGIDEDVSVLAQQLTTALDNGVVVTSGVSSNGGQPPVAFHWRQIQCLPNQSAC